MNVLNGPIPPGAGAAVAPSIAPGIPTITASAGGPFNIGGARFDQQGSVTVGGRAATVTSWDNNRIKGIMPQGVERPAEVVIVDGVGKVQRCMWDFPKAPQTVTVQVQVPQAAPASDQK